jgi:hypothetical protein
VRWRACKHIMIACVCIFEIASHVLANLPSRPVLKS